jgi:O-antigen/teichoic acid export membrane protein
MYAAIIPIVILKMFGDAAAGLFAVTTRAVTSALVAQEALVLPILSGGTFMFATGSRERIGLFLNKSFKITILSALPPLSFLAFFGPTLILVWTGQADALFRPAIWICSISALLKAISLLQLILYRASGKALLDNIRQVLRIGLILAIALFSRNLGFKGVLVGMAFAELAAVVFMFFAMEEAFAALNVNLLARDVLRMCAATAIIIGCGTFAGMIPHIWGLGVRLDAVIRLGQIFIGCLLVAWPALILTKSLSAVERRMLFDVIFVHRRSTRAIA